MSTASEAKAILLTAATVLEKKGWTRGAYNDYSTGRCCAVGALLHGSTVSGSEMSYLMAQDAMRREVGIGSTKSVESWNDNTAKGIVDVTMAMRRAAESLG